MSFSNIASLSPFGVVGQAIKIFLSNPLLFLWYTLPPLVFFRAGGSSDDDDDDGGDDGTVPVFPMNGPVVMALATILFLENLLLSDGWIAHQSAIFYAKQHYVHAGSSRVALSTRIAIRSANGQSLACVQLLNWLLLLAGGGAPSSASVWSTITSIVTFSIYFMPVIIAVEGGKSLGDVAQRSASIAQQMYWKVFQFYFLLVAFFGIGIVITGLILLTLSDTGFPKTEDEIVFEPPPVMRRMACELIVVPLFRIGLSVLYLQYRAEKEGLTVEKLAWELSGGDNVVVEKSTAIDVAKE
jgi:hypothetical protein